MEELQNILSRTLEMFMRYGIKSITMDDISRELGISKKTLYVHVENKSDLVMKAMQFYIDSEKQIIEQIKTNSKNAIDEMLQICNFICQMTRDRNPSLIMDMKRYHPEAWRLFIEHKHLYVYQHILRNIADGREQTMYRDDFNEEIIAKLYISRIDAVMDTDLFPINKYPFVDVVHEMLQYHINGIATSKGVKYLEKVKKES